MAELARRLKLSKVGTHWNDFNVLEAPKKHFFSVVMRNSNSHKRLLRQDIQLVVSNVREVLIPNFC